MILLFYNEVGGKNSSHLYCKLLSAASGDFITFFESSLHLLRTIDCQSNHHQNPNDIYIFAETESLIMKSQEATDNLNNFGKY